MKPRVLVKYLLTRLGERCSARTILTLNAVINYLEVGRWMQARGFVTPPRVDNRYQVFDLAARDVGERQVLYLEFGVAGGASLRYWSALLKHPGAQLHGFDTFEGLPERWNPRYGKGYFSTGGKIPTIDDPRIRFFVGLFADTLQTYQAPAHERLVITIDADLYSSAIVVLRMLRDLIRPGTYLYFDELQERDQEQKAFDEFLDETGMRFIVAGCDKTLTHVLFRRIE